MDVKSWDDEIDVDALKKSVRLNKMVSSVGFSKLVAVGFGYGIQITLVVGKPSGKLHDLY